MTRKNRMASHNCGRKREGGRSDRARGKESKLLPNKISIFQRENDLLGFPFVHTAHIQYNVCVHECVQYLFRTHCRCIGDELMINQHPNITEFRSLPIRCHDYVHKRKIYKENKSVKIFFLKALFVPLPRTTTQSPLSSHCSSSISFLPCLPLSLSFYLFLCLPTHLSHSFSF